MSNRSRAISRQGEKTMTKAEVQKEMISQWVYGRLAPLSNHAEEVELASGIAHGWAEEEEDGSEGERMADVLEALGQEIAAHHPKICGQMDSAGVREELMARIGEAMAAIGVEAEEVLYEILRRRVAGEASKLLTS